jgi:hypothetical protein
MLDLAAAAVVVAAWAVVSLGLCGKWHDGVVCADGRGRRGRALLGILGQHGRGAHSAAAIGNATIDGADDEVGRAIGGAKSVGTAPGRWR